MTEHDDHELLAHFAQSEPEADFDKLVWWSEALKRGCTNYFRCDQQAGNKRLCVTFRQAFTRFAVSWAAATCLKMAM